MKKALEIIALTLALGMGGVGCAAAEQVKVAFAAEPYPPFSSQDASGKWIGWEVEFTQAACTVAKLDCVIVPIAFDGLIPALTSKKVDFLVGSLSITDERKQTIDFSDKYYNTPAAVMGRKGEAFAATPAGLAGKVIGVQVSTSHQAYVAKYFAAKAASVKEYQTQDEANQDLAAGRIDATEADSTMLDDFVKSDAGACCDIKGMVEDDPAILGVGVGFGIRKGDAALKGKLDAAIKTLRADGTYATITKKYFAFDIYGK